MGFFIQVPTGRTLPAGSLIGVYRDRDTTLLKLKASEAQKIFRGSDYVISYGPGGYVVDDRPAVQKQKLICGPARSDENFDIFNCYFAYNST
jgi:hypothetical protein